MGLIRAAIELSNACDKTRWIREIVLVKNNVYWMLINERIRDQLDLYGEYKREVQLEDGRIVECDVAGPLTIRFAGIQTCCTAVVLPGDSEPILGRFPMEAMDLMIHPATQDLIVNPERPSLRLPGVRLLQ